MYVCINNPKSFKIPLAFKIYMDVMMVLTKWIFVYYLIEFYIFIFQMTVDDAACKFCIVVLTSDQ